jgi:hypothetical protein
MTAQRNGPAPRPPGGLPNLVVIGAMKCGTSALHAYLATHPQIAMAAPKELSFFYDAPKGARERAWSPGNRHRGVEWYAGHFRADSPVRGETSPGYTSPAHPEVASRMAALLPDARLILLVRDPIERAVSQYRHHAAEGTESRAIDQALLDPTSQYLARSRYYERLQPFLACFPREQILVLAAEELDADRRSALQAVFAFVGVDPGHWCTELEERHHVGRGTRPELDPGLRTLMRTALTGDADRLRALLGRDLPDWTV